MSGRGKTPAGTVFVVSGPSGCGKSTLIRNVMRELGDLQFSVSHTTRKRRPSEKEGVDYHFVTPRAFEKMVREDAFVEWAGVHGHLYGTSRSELESKTSRGDVVLDIDVQGARLVRPGIPDAVTVFVMPPGGPELRRRLEQRKEDNPSAVARRLADAAGEIPAYSEFDYVVVNDDLDAASAELRSIVVAARCRTSARGPRLRKILKSFAAGAVPSPPRGKGKP